MSKALTLSGQIGLTLLTVMLVGSITNVQATPVCMSTIVLPSGDGTLMESQLGTGVCVQSSDKLYGTFNFGNLPAGVSVTFSFTDVGGVDQHSIEFSSTFIGGTFQNFSYEVEVLEGGGFPTNNSITQLRGDVTQTIGTAQLMQTPSTTPSSGAINLTKTDDVVTGSSIANFSLAQNVTDLTVTTSFVRTVDSDASAVLNTIEEAVQTPEPASLETLVVALAGLAFGYLKLKSRPS